MPSPHPDRAASAPADRQWPRAIRFGLLAAGLALFSAGCAKRTVHAAPPVAAPPQPAPAAPPSTPSPAESKPAATPTAPAAPVPAPAPKPQPEARKPAAEPPPRPPAPQILPQLSPADEAEYMRETNKYIADAEGNLDRATGRQLSASQHDLAEKIRGFLDQARGAIRSADWTRAKNLSQKAYLLSVELVNSL